MATSTDISRIYSVPSVAWSTNIGPITTPPTFPSDCRSNIYDFQTLGLWPYNPFSWTYYTQGCAVSSCCPSPTPYSKPFDWLSSYYSPGVCPQDYVTCVGPPNLTPGPQETLAFCCPRNFRCPAGPNHEWFACQSDLPSDTVAYLMDDLQNQRTLGTETVTSVVYMETSGSNTVTYQKRVVAYPLQIRWKKEDRTPTITGTASSPAGLPTQTGPGNSTPQQTAGSHPSTGLSTGAKAGIGVGLGVLGLLVIAVLIWWHLRRRRTAGGPELLGPSDQPYSKPELEAAPPTQVYPRTELDANPVAHAKGAPHELWTPSNDSPQGRAELDPDVQKAKPGF